MNPRRLTKTTRWLPAAAIALAIGAGACSSQGATAPAAPAASSGAAAEVQGKRVPATPSEDGSTGATEAPADRDSSGTGQAKGGVTLVTLGDSLTAGVGEDSGKGYPGRIEDALNARGQNVAQVVNLGRSGWTSQQLIDGAEGDRSQLVAAKEAIAEAKAAGSDVIATVLIGSNDLWRLYDPEDETSEGAERDDLDHYRRNMQQIVSTLRGAGATVIVGINDDQSKRPMMADETMRQNTLPGVSANEVKRMSGQAKRYADIVRDVAKENGVKVADFLNASLFSNPGTLADDGGHPNAKGYEEMTKVWLEAIGGQR